MGLGGGGEKSEIEQKAKFEQFYTAVLAQL